MKKGFTKEKEFICFLLAVISVFVVVTGFAIMKRNKVITNPIADYTIKEISDLEYTIQTTVCDGGLSVEGTYSEPNASYHYYDYPLQLEGQSVYGFMHLACVDGDKVYEFPTWISYGFYKSEIEEKYADILDRNGLSFVIKTPEGELKLYENN